MLYAQAGGMELIASRLLGIKPAASAPLQTPRNAGAGAGTSGGSVRDGDAVSIAVPVAGLAVGGGALYLPMISGVGWLHCTSLGCLITITTLSNHHIINHRPSAVHTPS